MSVLQSVIYSHVPSRDRFRFGMLCWRGKRLWEEIKWYGKARDVTGTLADRSR
jgi:hypothetical protein